MTPGFSHYFLAVYLDAARQSAKTKFGYILLGRLGKSIYRSFGSSLSTKTATICGSGCKIKLRYLLFHSIPLCCVVNLSLEVGYLIIPCSEPVSEEFTTCDVFSSDNHKLTEMILSKPRRSSRYYLRARIAPVVILPVFNVFSCSGVNAS